MVRLEAVCLTLAHKSVTSAGVGVLFVRYAAVRVVGGVKQPRPSHRRVALDAQCCVCDVAVCAGHSTWVLCHA